MTELHEKVTSYSVESAIPRSVESERALLGTILIDPSIIDRIGIAPSTFYDLGNQTIYSAMRSIGSRDLDYVVLLELLERKDKLESIGGAAYITGLINECPNTFNYESYERVIRDTSTRREVIGLCEQLAGAAINEKENINDAISRAVSELVQSARPKGGALPISHYLKMLYEEVEERAADPKEIYGLETGLVDFDKITAGLQQGEEFILAGQPGTGKSLLAFQMGCGMAKNGHAGVVYSLEMTGVAMVRRRVSAISKIPTYNLRSGVDMNKRWDKFLKAFEKMERLPISIADASDWTTLQMRADLSRLKQQENVKWFVVDYHDLLADSYGKDAIEKSAYLSQQIHGICKDLDLAGLVIQSLNKAGYHSTPTMANLSGSTRVMHTADHIAFMVQDEKQDNIVNLIWDKVREGEGKRTMKLVRVKGFPSFENYLPDNSINDWTR